MRSSIYSAIYALCFLISYQCQTLHWNQKVSHILKGIVENAESDVLETSYSLGVLKYVVQETEFKEITQKLNKKRLCQRLEAHKFPINSEKIFGLLTLDSAASCKTFSLAVLEESVGQVKDFMSFYYLLRAREFLSHPVSDVEKKTADKLFQSLPDSSTSEIVYAFSTYLRFWPKSVPQSLSDLFTSKFTSLLSKKSAVPAISQPHERHLNWILFEAMYLADSSSSVFKSPESELQIIRNSLIDGMSDFTPKSLFFFGAVRREVSKQNKLKLAPIAKVSTRTISSPSSPIKVVFEFLEDVSSLIYKSLTVEVTKVSCNRVDSTKTLKPLKYDEAGNYFVLLPSEIHQVSNGPSTCEVNLKVLVASSSSEASSVDHALKVVYTLTQTVKYGDCLITLTSAESSAEHSLSYPKTMSLSTLSPFSLGDKITITLQLPTVVRADTEKYHVGLSIISAHAAHQLSSSLVFGLCKSKGSGAECTITLDAEKLVQDSVSHISYPVLNLTIRLMDPLLMTESAWYLGQIRSTLGQQISVNSQNDAVYSWVTELKPTFFHVFPKPLKTPMAIISMVFTIAVLALAGGLIVLWLSLSLPIFSEIIPNMLKSPSALIFFSGFAAIFAIYMKFWINWTMFPALKVLLPVVSFTSYVGNRMMAHK